MSTILTRSKLSILIFVVSFSSLVLTACRVTFVPSYDADVSAQVTEVSKTVDRFYLTMLETTSNNNNERSFRQFAQQYVDIEVELNSLLNKNKVKSLNENSVRICEITLELWQKYKEEHKSDDNLSDGLIKLNRKTFSDLFYAMQVAEEGKKLVANPPQ